MPRGRSRPIAPERRDAFLNAVVLAIAQSGEIGPGSVHRAIRAAQREYLHPADLSHEHAPRWSSRRRNGVRQAPQSSAGAE